MNKPPQRYGMVVRVKADKVEEYKRLHAAVWPGVLEMIKACHLSNYSIYLRRLDDGEYHLFAYFEYAGNDFAADMAKMAADPITQQWWAVCKPCLQPLAGVSLEQCWAGMEEVFHLE
jgi:L-rhamnose mutarotase